MASEYIGIKAAVAEACSTIKNVTEQEKVLSRQWIYRAIRQIGVGKVDIKISDNLTLTDWSVRKPDDMAMMIDIALFDSADQEIIIKYKGRGQSSGDGTLSRIHQDARPFVGAVNVTEDNDFFNVEEFSDDTPANVYLVVKYYSYPVDDDGYPKVQDIHMEACIAYVRWQWAKRERVSLGEIQETRHTWLQEKASAYGRMKTPTEMEAKDSFRELNSMIQKMVPRLRQF